MDSTATTRPFWKPPPRFRRHWVILRLETKGPREVAVHGAVFDSRSKVACRLVRKPWTLPP
jgi:hypothetical protein